MVCAHHVTGFRSSLFRHSTSHGWMWPQFLCWKPNPQCSLGEAVRVSRVGAGRAHSGCGHGGEGERPHTATALVDHSTTSSVCCAKQPAWGVLLPYHSPLATAEGKPTYFSCSCCQPGKRQPGSGAERPSGQMAASISQSSKWHEGCHSPG